MNDKKYEKQVRGPDCGLWWLINRKFYQKVVQINENISKVNWLDHLEGTAWKTGLTNQKAKMQNTMWIEYRRRK